MTRSASAAEIKSAYRKLARRYHPDRYASADITEAERAAVTARMADINAAYDALRYRACNRAPPAHLRERRGLDRPCCSENLALGQVLA